MEVGVGRVWSGKGWIWLAWLGRARRPPRCRGGSWGVLLVGVMGGAREAYGLPSLSSTTPFGSLVSERSSSLLGSEALLGCWGGWSSGIVIAGGSVGCLVCMTRKMHAGMDEVGNMLKQRKRERRNRMYTPDKSIKWERIDLNEAPAAICLVNVRLPTNHFHSIPNRLSTVLASLSDYCTDLCSMLY